MYIPTLHLHEQAEQANAACCQDEPHAKMQACLCCPLPYTPVGENKPRSVGHTPITDAKKYCYEPATLLRRARMKRGVLHAKAQGHKM